MEEQGTSVVILQGLKPEVKALRDRWGTFKNVTNAALWMFSRATLEDQDRAITAIAKLLDNSKGVEDEAAIAADVIEAEGEAAESRAERLAAEERKAAGKGQSA